MTIFVCKTCQNKAHSWLCKFGGTPETELTNFHTLLGHSNFVFSSAARESLNNWWGEKLVAHFERISRDERKTMWAVKKRFILISGWERRGKDQLSYIYMQGARTWWDQRWKKRPAHGDLSPLSQCGFLSSRASLSRMSIIITRTPRVMCRPMIAAHTTDTLGQQWHASKYISLCAAKAFYMYVCADRRTHFAAGKRMLEGILIRDGTTARRTFFSLSLLISNNNTYFMSHSIQVPNNTCRCWEAENLSVAFVEQKVALASAAEASATFLTCKSPQGHLLVL